MWLQCTTHDPPLVFPVPQAAAKGCPLMLTSTENQPATVWLGHRLMSAFGVHSPVQPASSTVSVKASGSWVYLERYFIFLLFYLLKHITCSWWLSWLTNCVTSSHVFPNNIHCILHITETNLSEWCKDVKPSSVCGLHLHWGDLKFPWLRAVLEA